MTTITYFVIFRSFFVRNEQLAHCGVFSMSRKHVGHARHGERPSLTVMRTRFESYCERVDGDFGCWLWRGGGRPGDYGKFRLPGRSVQAHRGSWELYVGELEPGILVLHHCDVRSCVNWLHLQSGYSTDNMRHMHTRGRSRWGPNRQPAQPWTEQDFRAWAAKIEYRLEDAMHIAIALQSPDTAHRLIDEASDAAGWLGGTHGGDQLRRVAHRSMDIVLRCTRSSIERAFFGSLVLRSLGAEGLLVAVDCATVTDLLHFRHRVRRLHELREEYAIEQGRGFGDFTGFIEWLGPEADIEFLVLYQQLGLQEMPHLALHVERSGGTRVDGLVFHPLDESETVVPCGRLADVDAALQSLNIKK